MQQVPIELESYCVTRNKLENPNSITTHTSLVAIRHSSILQILVANKLIIREFIQ